MYIMVQRNQLTDKSIDNSSYILHPFKGITNSGLTFDTLKTNFKKDDIVLDPFCGAGTTLVNCNLLGINAIGIDIASMNARIANASVSKYDFGILESEITKVTKVLQEYIQTTKVSQMNRDMKQALSKFNLSNNKNPMDFLHSYYSILYRYEMDAELEGRYLKSVLKEFEILKNAIFEIKDDIIKNLLIIILSKTMHASMSVPHHDQTDMAIPVNKPYFCIKHQKICIPVFSILSHWNRYVNESLKVLKEFAKVRSNTLQYCYNGDSRILKLQDKQIDGIFTAPPYLGTINSHEQFAYGYDLFKFLRNDRYELGSLLKITDKQSKETYIKEMSEAFTNCLQYCKTGCKVFIVSSDKFNVFDKIAQESNLKYVDTLKKFKTPVLQYSNNNN
jgi:16S rRNA G966 N2-methylase RsmD